MRVRQLIGDTVQGRTVTAGSYYILLILTLVSVLNFVDRQALYILIEQIRIDIAMTDTQVGLLTGASFAIVYGISGLWVARIADRRPRNVIIAISVFVWSAATALGSLSATFWHLAVTRLGVAAGEAGSTPAAHSLIADLFPHDRRAFALALFACGTPIGVMIGYVGGGWLASTLSWREALFWLGVPGLILSVLVFVFIRDPRAKRAPDGELYRGAASELLRIPIFRHMMAAASLFAASAYALSAFQPSFLIRQHGFTTAQAGLALGLIHGLGGAVGTLLGGYLADRLGKFDVRWRQWVPAVGAVLSAPLTVLALLVDNAITSVVLMAAPVICGLLYLAPTFALAQSIAHPSARATASALILLSVSLLGQSCGPLLVGLLSDALRTTYGESSLRMALLSVPAIQLWSSLHFWIAGKNLRSLELRS